MRIALSIIFIMILAQAAYAISVPVTAIKPIAPITVPTVAQPISPVSPGSPTETACSPPGATKCAEPPFGGQMIFQQCVQGTWVYRDYCTADERCDSQRGCIPKTKVAPVKPTMPAIKPPPALQRPTAPVLTQECQACEEIRQLRIMLADLLERLQRLERPRCAGPGQNPTMLGGRCCPGLVADSAPRCGMPGGPRNTCAPEGTRADMYGSCCEGLREVEGICTSTPTRRSCVGPEQALRSREGCCPGLVLRGTICSLPPADDRGCADMNLRPELYGGQCCEGLLEVDGICTRIYWD